MDLQSELASLHARIATLESQKNQAPPTMRVAEAARYLGFSYHYLHRLHLRGEGPARTKIGARMWAYKKTDLDAWLAEQGDGVCVIGIEEA